MNGSVTFKCPEHLNESIASGTAVGPVLNYNNRRHITIGLKFMPYFFLSNIKGHIIYGYSDMIAPLLSFLVSEFILKIISDGTTGKFSTRVRLKVKIFLYGYLDFAITIAAINRFITARFEGNFGIFAAFGTFYREHLAGNRTVAIVTISAAL
jgi:hypothetical protein